MSTRSKSARERAIFKRALELKSISNRPPVLTIWNRALRNAKKEYDAGYLKPRPKKSKKGVRSGKSGIRPRSYRKKIKEPMFTLS